MDQRGVLVVVVHVDAEEVDTDRMFLPHAVKQHHHSDVIIYYDGNVRILHNGDLHPETQKHVRQSDAQATEEDAVDKAGVVTHPV